jgi:hypothetical protein
MMVEDPRSHPRFRWQMLELKGFALFTRCDGCGEQRHCKGKSREQMLCLDCFAKNTPGISPRQGRGDAGMCNLPPSLHMKNDRDEGARAKPRGQDVPLHLSGTGAHSAVSLTKRRDTFKRKEEALRREAVRLREEGLVVSAIAERLGKTDRVVRRYLREARAA